VFVAARVVVIPDDLSRAADPGCVGSTGPTQRIVEGGVGGVAIEEAVVASGVGIVSNNLALAGDAKGKSALRGQGII